jgi:hypothetical protein
LNDSINNIVKSIVTKCKKHIRELENINFSISFEVGENKKSNDEKILTAKKNEIELLMDLSPIVKENL